MGAVNHNMVFKSSGATAADINGALKWIDGTDFTFGSYHALGGLELNGHLNGDRTFCMVFYTSGGLFTDYLCTSSSPAFVVCQYDCNSVKPSKQEQH